MLHIAKFEHLETRLKRVDTTDHSGAKSMINVIRDQ